MTPIDVAHAALLEAGRPDLADGIIWYCDDSEEGGGYIEFNDEILSESDWAIIDRAEALARSFVAATGYSD